MLSRPDIIRKMQNETFISKELAETLLDMVFESIAETLEKEEPVSIRKFGRFDVKEHGGYAIYSPILGKSTTISVRKKIYFKPSEHLVTRLNPQFAKPVKSTTANDTPKSKAKKNKKA